MASGAGGEKLSLRHGVRCVPANGEQVEEILLAVGERIGCENIHSASRMDKAVVIFLKKEKLVDTLCKSVVVLNDDLLDITPLSTPATRVVISNVPPFVGDGPIVDELIRFGKFVGPMSDLPLGCRDHAVKHVLSFRRQVYMFLNNREQTLDVNFKVKHGGKSYTVYATTERLRCFGCGEVGHKRLSCPRRAAQPESSGGDAAGAQQQQRGDSQEKVTGEQEPRAEGYNVSPRSQQEEVSAAHTTGATAVPSDSVDTCPHAGNDNDTRPHASNVIDTRPHASNDTDTRPRASNTNDTRPRTSDDTDTRPRTSNKNDTRPRTSDKNDTRPRTSNKTDTRPRISNETGTSNDKGTRPRTSNETSDTNDTAQRPCLKPDRAATSGGSSPTLPQQEHQQDVNVDDKDPKMDRIGRRMERVEYPSKHDDEMSEDSSSECGDGSSGNESMEEEEATAEQPYVFNRPQEPVQLYTQEQINRFLKMTKGKRNVVLTNFFPDRKAFVSSAQHSMGVMSPRRRYRLKKWAAIARSELLGTDSE